MFRQNIFLKSLIFVITVMQVSNYFNLSLLAQSMRIVRTKLVSFVDAVFSLKIIGYGVQPEDKKISIKEKKIVHCSTGPTKKNKKKKN